MISLDYFKKVELAVGQILSAEKVPDTDKLLKLSVDFGLNGAAAPAAGAAATPDIRQIISGIAEHFPDPQTLVGKNYIFVTNLEPRIIKGLESNGMILALQTAEGKLSLITPEKDMPAGTKAK